MAAKTTFLVKFFNVGRNKLTWEERIPRPVTKVEIVRAVKRKKALMSHDVDAPYVDDWGGRIYAGVREVGSYVIVMGSEQPVAADAVDPHAGSTGKPPTRDKRSS